MPKYSARRAMTALIGTVGLSLAAAGCVSIPSGGPVLSYPVSQGANAQNQYSLQIVPQPPLRNGIPTDIVSGFITADASFAGQQQVAREYLIPAASHAWKPGWTATVFKGSPTVTGAAPGAKQKTATVTVEGTVQAFLSDREAYAAPSATPKNKTATYHYDLVKDGTQWRISHAPNTLLLTSTEFAVDYQLLNLYFFDPSGGRLVPDPVYVPLQATEADLVNKLVQSLIKPPGDWIGNATITKFPLGTQSAVTVDGGTASVSLAGKAVSKLTDTTKEQISAQLFATLTGAGQGQQQQVKSIVLTVNGKQFVPRGGNAVQNQPNRFTSAVGPRQAGFYYLKPTGQLMWRKNLGDKHPVTIATIGKGYTSLAVSPDGQFFAAVQGGSLYTGKIGTSKPNSRDVPGDITSLSWDRNGYLWVVAGSTVYRLSALRDAPDVPPTRVTVPARGTCGSSPGDVTALRVAPDGVRVAIVFGGGQETLAFGAIVLEDAPVRSGQQPQSQVSVDLSPFFVCGSNQAFKAVSWYGAGDVIALGEPGDTVTSYPVNGGTPTEVTGPSGSTWITAAANEGVIVSQARQVSIAPALSGTWSPFLSATSPAFPG